MVMCDSSAHVQGLGLLVHATSTCTTAVTHGRQAQGTPWTLEQGMVPATMPPCTGSHTLLLTGPMLTALQIRVCSMRNSASLIH
jgi:hypothetical protein